VSFNDSLVNRTSLNTLSLTIGEGFSQTSVYSSQTSVCSSVVNDRNVDRVRERMCTTFYLFIYLRQKDRIGH